MFAKCLSDYGVRGGILQDTIEPSIGANTITSVFIRQYAVFYGIRLSVRICLLLYGEVSLGYNRCEHKRWMLQVRICLCLLISVSTPFFTVSVCLSVYGVRGGIL